MDPTRLTIEGYYTPQDGLIAVGVTACQSVSDWPVKRQAELLGMRTAFIDWFLLQALSGGGSGEIELLGPLICRPTGLERDFEPLPYSRLNAIGS